MHCRYTFFPHETFYSVLAYPVSLLAKFFIDTGATVSATAFLMDLGYLFFQFAILLLAFAKGPLTPPVIPGPGNF